ncbi:MAG: glycosyltransferase family 4 protein [Gammaproteobacteria bacterium]|nr:glycosyltransferase family 4 protein [Gammaproteobacteria bacterium]
MHLLYAYMTIAAEGSQVHADSFVRAFREIGGRVTRCGIAYDPYTGGKESWSLAKRLAVRMQWILSNFGYAFRVVRAARSSAADVVLFRFDPLNRLTVAIVLASWFRPVVLEINAVRSIENAEGRPRISDWLDGIALRRAKRIFVVSNVLRGHIREHYGIEQRKIAVVENGVDERRFRPDIDGLPIRRKLGLTDNFTVGLVSSFRPWHGVELLLDIAEVVCARLPSVVFVLVGDGSDRPRYEDLAREKRLTDNVLFTGLVPHDDVPRYTAAMDVLVAPWPLASYRNGFYGSALKIFEYMAMGKPVITAGLGQILEVIDDGVSGLIVAAEDANGFADAIIGLKNDSGLRDRLGAAAREKVTERYTWKQNAEKIMRLCQDAIGKSRGDMTGDSTANRMSIKP